MTTKYLWNWSLLIGVATGIYVCLYILSPLNDYGVVYATFVALPIYFISGAKREEFFHFSASSIVGVLWGAVYLFAIGRLLEADVPNLAAQSLVCGIVTVICCGFHFTVTGRTIFNKLPAMFGGIAVAFSTGGTNIIPLMLTLVLGDLLALICSESARLLNEDGSWKFLSSKY